MTPAIRPQPPEASDKQPPPSALHPSAQIAGGVAGSVAVTLVAKTLGGSPWATLAVAVIGASLPVLISYSPRHRHLRLGIVVIVVAVAFALTYGGFSLYDAASGKQTFPRPGPTPTPTPDGGGGGDGGDGTAHAQVTPPSLTCTPDQCGQVKIANVGDADLRVGEITFVDDAPNGFTRDGECAGDTIAPQRDCTFDVDFDPPFDAGTRTATLVVPTSDGRNESVQLQGSGGEPADFAFAAPPVCSLTAASLVFTITGPEEAKPLVITDATDPLPQQPVGEEVTVPLGPTPPATVSLEINPLPPQQAEAIPELDHDDNTATVTCG